MTTVRRCAAALAASAVLGVALAPAAHAGGDVPVTPAPSASSPAPDASSPSTAPSPSPSKPAPGGLPAGLYGTKDPTYDGVWRQSLALLGQYTGGYKPAKAAVTWLKGQQCANGAFPAYRADPTTPCDTTTAVDSNSTAAAVQALSSLGGQRPAMRRAVAWLRSVQNADGGWSYTPGTPSDANSTSLVIGAFTAAGVRPGSVRSPEGKNAYDSLVGFAIPCEPGADAGAFAYQPDADGRLSANEDATGAAVLAGLGKRMVTAPVPPGPAPDCVRTAAPSPERAARNGAAHLVSALGPSGHLVQPPLPGTDDSTPLPDVGNTADAVVALAAAGYGNQAAQALEWLKTNAAGWAEENGPAAYAQLLFAAHATGTDPRDFGGVDLVQRLNATGPTPTPLPSASASATTASAADDAAGPVLPWAVGTALVACAGLGLLIRRRGRARRS
ncbi:prenyltransferase/squalene oxidase repeat-containing protein [Streptomyces sp. NPDC001780]